MKIYHCIKCGYIYQDDKAPAECPICHHPQSYFEEINKDIDSQTLIESRNFYISWMNSHQYQEKIGLTNDETIKEFIVSQLVDNLKKSGQTYCPCRLRTSDFKKDRKIICPCIYHMGEIELQGKCHCGLFVKK